MTAGGRFRAGGLLAGKYEVKIGGTHDGGGYWVTRVVEAGDEDLVLTTERYVGQESRTLRVKVVDPDGNPVPRCTVDVHHERDGSTWDDEYDAYDGELPVEFWGQGQTMTVSVSGARTSSGSPLPLGAARIGPLPARDGEVEVRLTREQVIEGSVITPGGKGVRGVRIEALPTYAEALDFDTPHAVAFTDDRGSFRLPGLGATEHRLTLSAPPSYLPVEPIVTTPGHGKVRIEITPGATVRLTVLDSGRKPVSGAWVTVDIPDDYSFERRSDITRADGTASVAGLDASRPYTLGAAVAEDGTFRFTGVPGGECVVTAHAMADRGPVEGHSWTEAGGTVLIELGSR